MSAPVPGPDAPQGARLVVADDQEDLLAMMQDALSMEGYQVRGAYDGEEALKLVREDPPDIIVLDLNMPRKTGFEVCKELKADPGFQHLPIIMLSGTTEMDDKVQGMELGADDFVTKPVNLVELLARIRMILRRTRQGLDANPLTRLPGNVSIQGKINQAIATKNPLAVLYYDLNNFKAYNDIYGFSAGDDVIKATAKCIVDSVQAAGTGADFVGHIGGDDFIVVTTPEKMEAIAQQSIDRFDRLVLSFYNEEHRRAGKIKAKDRRGQDVEYELLGIAIGICHTDIKPLENFAQVSQIGAELKKFAKTFDGSKYVIDRRKD